MIVLKKILVPTDLGEAADAALNYARALARNFNASIDVLHVAEDISTRMLAHEMYVAVPQSLQNDVEEAARKQLAARLIDNDPNPLPVRPVVITSNAPADSFSSRDDSSACSKAEVSGRASSLVMHTGFYRASWATRARE